MSHGLITFTNSACLKLTCSGLCAKVLTYRKFSHIDHNETGHSFVCLDLQDYTVHTLQLTSKL